MAVRTSTGFAAAILGPQSFDQIFLNGCMEIRTGVQPATADDIATGTLIGRITQGGGAWTAGVSTNGLQFERNGRFAAKPPLQAWALDGLATGVAGWFRLLPNALDPGTFSFTARRIDGAVGLIADSGDVQLFLPTLDLTIATSIAINQWWYAMPPIGE